MSNRRKGRAARQAASDLAAAEQRVREAAAVAANEQLGPPVCDRCGHKPALGENEDGWKVGVNSATGYVVARLCPQCGESSGSESA